LGEEIFDPVKIRNKYLAGSFLIDFASSFPFSSFFELFVTEGIFLQILSALGLLKLIRLTRIYPTLRKQNLPYDQKIVIKIILMTFFIIVALHMISAIWFFLVTEN